MRWIACSRATVTGACCETAQFASTMSGVFTGTRARTIEGERPSATHGARGEEFCELPDDREPRLAGDHGLEMFERGAQHRVADLRHEDAQPERLVREDALDEPVREREPELDDDRVEDGDRELHQVAEVVRARLARGRRAHVREEARFETAIVPVEEVERRDGGVGGVEDVDAGEEGCTLTLRRRVKARAEVGRFEEEGLALRIDELQAAGFARTHPAIHEDVDEARLAFAGGTEDHRGHADDARREFQCRAVRERADGEALVAVHPRAHLRECAVRASAPRSRFASFIFARR
jgi:hypothetical protein